MAVKNKYRFTVEVEAETLEQAKQVSWERIGLDEDYGFEYTIDIVESAHRVLPEARPADGTEVALF